MILKMILGFYRIAFQAAEITAYAFWYISGEKNQIASFVLVQVLISSREPLGFSKARPVPQHRLDACGFLVA